MTPSEMIFRPIQGEEAKLLKTTLTRGAVLFSTDTGKIFMDTANGRIPMGSSGASLLYGKAENSEPDEDGLYTLSFNDLDDSSLMPKENDLILNSDGTFYRVMEVNEGQKTLLCLALSVSGTGGGGSGGPSGLAKAISLKGSPLSTYTLVNGQKMFATFIASSAIDAFGEVQDEELTINWNLTVTATGVNYDSGNFKVKNGESIDFEFGSRLRESTGSTLSVYATGVNSGRSKTITYEVSTVELKLETSEKFMNVAPYSSSFTMYCNVYGSIRKILEFYLDGQLVGSKVLSANAVGEQSLTVKNISHGNHTVKIDLYQYLDNDTKGIGVKTPLAFEIAVNAGSSDPIIWLGDYKPQYYNYDSVKIPYRVFNPNKATSEVTFLKGISEMDTRTVKSGATYFSIWEITNTTLDLVNTYYIQVEKNDRLDEDESKYIRREISFEVVQDPNRDLSLVSPETLMLSFSAAGRANTESKTGRQLWSYTDKNTNKVYQGKFENFNWYNNGWILDEDNNTCLRVSNGAKFIIPIGNMVLNNPSAAQQQSKTFEFEFKIRNVQDYSNLIKEYTRYNGDQEYWNAFMAQIDNEQGYTNYDNFLHYILSQPDATTTYDKLTETFAGITRRVASDTPFCTYYDSNNRGFCLGAQDGFFATAQNILNIKYVEDKMINLSIVFNYTDKRIYMYLQGVLTAVSNITDTGALEINANNLIFNSEYCDVDIYKIRIYNNALSVRDILINYAVDRVDIPTYDHTTQLLSYNQNTGEYQLNFSSVDSWNKNSEHLDEFLMPYVLFDTGSATNRLPYSKVDKKAVGMTFVNTGLDRAYQDGTLEDLANGMSQAQKDAAAKEGLTLVQYYYKHHCPSWTSRERKVSLGVQGTSSEFYPRRNYKAKTKGTDEAGKDCIYMYMNRGPFAELYLTNPEKCQLDFFYYDNYTVGTTKFTMKIDFMESSGTYNMGLANLVDGAYTKHPLDDYNSANAFNAISYVLSTSESADDNMTYYADSKGSTKVTFNEEIPYEPNKYYIPTYKNYSFQNTTDYRTNVQGFPVMAFWKYGDTDNDYQFIGRYNMLTDKGSDETFGFKPSKSITAPFGKTKKGVQTTVRKIAECWEYSDNNRGYCSFRDPQNRHKLSFDSTETIMTDEGPKVQRALNAKGSCPVVADSFEYRYNTNGDLLDYFYDPELNSSVYETLLEDYTATQLADIEWRSEEMLKIYSNWEKACQWVWSTCLDNVPSQEEENFESKTRKIMRYEPASGEFSNDEIYYDLNEDIVAAPTEEEFSAGLYLQGIETPVTYDKETFIYDTKEYRKAKFTNEVTEHFDLEYLLVYFIVTEALLCYDSRGKNCMMASWGPQKAGGEYIWYPVFYDMDTQLGINNTGIPSFEYFENATRDGTFSTSDSILWQNLYTCFFTNIAGKYSNLRTGFKTLFGKDEIGPFKTVDHIERWYLADPVESGEIVMRGQRPLAMFNMDEFFKYISICNPKIGYQNRQGGISQDTGTYFYALQGDRSLSRQQFLARRLNFIDSWLAQGNYSREEGTAIETRLSANDPGNISDKWITGTTNENVSGLEQNVPYYVTDEEGNPVLDARNFKKKTNYLDANLFIELTPYQNSYVTMGRDNAAWSSYEYKGTAVPFYFPESIQEGMKNSPRLHEALAYIYGASALKDIGDVSMLYFNNFKAINAPHLQRILLGNDHPQFYNNTLQTPEFDAASTSQHGKPLLEEVNLSGVKFLSDAIKDCDFSSSEKLQIFKAIRSNITTATFAKGVALHTLYLPETITALKLTEAANLTKVINYLPMEYPDNYYSQYDEKTDVWTAQQGLYIEGLTNFTGEVLPTSNHSISEVNIAGGSLGYGSYDIINTLYRIYKYGEGNGSKDLRISLTDVDWSPYKLLDVEAVYDSNITYYTDDFHYGFKAYNYSTEAQWKIDLLNKEVYYYDEDWAADATKITSIDMLLDFINRPQFKNTTDIGESVPVLTGSIYVNNSEPIDEDTIRNILLAPNAFAAQSLNIHFANVKKGYSARFISVEDNGTYKLIGTQVLPSILGITTRFTSPYTLYEVKKDNFDFWGWSLTNSKDDAILENEWNQSPASQIVEGVYDYTFYAVFSRHPFNITYLAGNDAATALPVYTTTTLYGDFLTEPKVIPSLDESTLGDTERYRFLGWTQDRNNLIVSSVSSAKLINVNNIQAIDDYTFYGVFMKESVYDSVTGEGKLENYFTFLEDTSYTDRLDSSYNISGGYTLAVKAGISLSGKVTLPVTYNNQPITSIYGQGFEGQKNITHIFFDNKETNEIRSFGNRAFYGCTSLKKIELPAMLRVISGEAFANCSALLNRRFAGNIITINEDAFRGCFGSLGASNDIVYLGGSINRLSKYAFRNFVTPINELVIGGENDPSQLTNIGMPAWRQNKNYELTKITIYCTPDTYDYFHNQITYGPIDTTSNFQVLGDAVNIVMTR